MKKILFVIPSLRGGGAERIFSILVNNINRKKFEPVLLLIKGEGEYLDDIAGDVKIIDLNINKVRYSPFKIAKSIICEKPDIVFSTLGYMNVLIGLLIPFIKLFKPNISFIAREANIASLNNDFDRNGKILNLLYKITNSKYSKIICQSEYMKNDLIKNYGLNTKNMIVINNPLDFKKINKLKREKVNLDNKNYIIGVGRLSKRKRFDLLIHAYNKIRKKNLDLFILGKGSEKSRLQKLSRKLKREENIHFLGFQKNPYKYLNRARLLVLTSKYEGFPNVVLEANACGIPVVAFDCPSGISEIIKDGENGFLVQNENIDELASKIEQALEYPFDTAKIIKITEERFKLEKIMGKYEECIGE